MYGEAANTDTPGSPKRPTRKKARMRFSITLSEKAAQSFQEIKEWTDADTDTEVFRNALRLQRMLLKAHQDGKRFLMEDAKTGQSSAIMLFNDVE